MGSSKTTNQPATGPRKKIHGYVFRESSGLYALLAFRPGDYNQGVPVSASPDLIQWTKGKKETIALYKNPNASKYERECAKKIMRLNNWEDC